MLQSSQMGVLTTISYVSLNFFELFFWLFPGFPAQHACFLIPKLAVGATKPRKRTGVILFPSFLRFWTTLFFSPSIFLSVFLKVFRFLGPGTLPGHSRDTFRDNLGQHFQNNNRKLFFEQRHSKISTFLNFFGNNSQPSVLARFHSGSRLFGQWNT